MASDQPGSMRLIFTLATAGLISGIVLVGVFLATAPRIARNRAEALAAAVFRVLPGTTTTRTFELVDERIVPRDDSDAADGATLIYAGLDEGGALVGYAIAAEGPGYMDTVGLLYGLDPAQRKIVGMEVLESRETPGLGDKILGDAHFLSNFEALAVEPSIVAVKKGEKTSANEVDCITGATISSEAVVAILDKSARLWLERIGDTRPQNKGRQDGDTAEP